MNVIPCEYGKYAAVDVECIIDFRSQKNSKGEFHRKDAPFNLELIPIVGWIVDDEKNRYPILTNGEKIENPAIVDVDSGNWWFDCETGMRISSLNALVKKYIEIAIEDDDE